MKRTFIKYKGEHYSIEHCMFFADCIRYEHPEACSEDHITMLNGEWELVEEEIVPNKRTYQEWLDYLDLCDKLTEEAELKFMNEHGNPPKDYKKYAKWYNDRHNYAQAYLKANLPLEN